MRRSSTRCSTSSNCSDQNPSCENHDAVPIERAPVDCSEHMKNMRNAKQNKRKIQKDAIAMRTQLSQMSVPHHGPAHLAAAIEQHAHMLSTVVTMKRFKH